jgi:hypothetical protein
LSKDILQLFPMMNIKLPCLLFLFALSFSVTSQELYRYQPGRESRLSSFENLNGLKSNGGRTNAGAKGNAFEKIPAGQSKTMLQVNGSGIIQRIWCTISERDPEMLRSVRLQFFWDGAAKPAVDVPLGDFFGVGLGRTVAFENALFSNPEGRSFNCFIPMPFRRSAKMVVINESKKDVGLFFYDVDFIMTKSPEPDMLYFHAYWTRQPNSELGSDFTFLPTVTGKGRFLGVNFGIISDSNYTGTWFGEGEVKMYLDGDTEFPTINGTGTEDYIGTGWGQGAYINRYQGCTIADEKARQFTFYRYHIPDEIWFHKNFRASIQQIGGGDYKLVKALMEKGARMKPVTVATDTGFVRLFELKDSLQISDSRFPRGWVNFYRVDDYSSTSYFYLDRPESRLSSVRGSK